MPYFATKGAHRSAANTHYGWRKLNGKNNFHKGIDYVSIDNREQYPSKIMPGVIVFAGIDSSGGGKMVWGKYVDGTGFYYLHCKELFVKTGQKFNGSTLLSIEGMTGKATGIHTHHVELTNGDKLSSHHNFKLEVRPDTKPKLSTFDELLLKDRPDVDTDWYRAGKGTPTDWWNQGGYIEFLLAVGMHNRNEKLLVDRLWQAEDRGDLKGWLRDWYQYYLKNEYENVWSLFNEKKL